MCIGVCGSYAYCALVYVMFVQVSTEFCVEYERMEACVIQRDWELQYVEPTAISHVFHVFKPSPRFVALELQSLKHELEVWAFLPAARLFGHKIAVF
jgi:hypothetical protein